MRYWYFLVLTTIPNLGEIKVLNSWKGKLGQNPNLPLRLLLPWSCLPTWNMFFFNSTSFPIVIVAGLSFSMEEKLFLTYFWLMDARIDNRKKIEQMRKILCKFGEVAKMKVNTVMFAHAWLSLILMFLQLWRCTVMIAYAQLCMSLRASWTRNCMAMLNHTWPCISLCWTFV